MFTTKFSSLFVAAALCAAASTAEAKPRRVVVLDLDGRRALADMGRNALVSLLAKQYDIVSTKKWIDAKAQVSRKTHGPLAWSKAAKQAGVDALIDGYINEDGRAKTLTVIVTNASNGNTLDEFTVRLGEKGLTEKAENELSRQLEERFEFIEPITEGVGAGYEPYKPVKDKKKIGARKDPDETTTDVEEPADDDQPRRKRTKKTPVRDTDDQETADNDVTEKQTKVATIETKQTKDEKEADHVKRVFEPLPEEVLVVNPKANRISRPTPRARFAGGFEYGSRSLFVGAEDPTLVDQFTSVPNKGLALSGQFYPFPREKRDGVLSGIGFSFEIGKSLGGGLVVVGEEQSTEFSINQYQWHAGVHYRVALGDSFAIDGEVGYGQAHYNLIDPPAEYEIPDVGYQYLTAGGSLDLKITERASVGFGAKYLYMLDTGNLNDTGDFVGYGPGTSWGAKADAHFIIPLPKNLFVGGSIAYSRVKSTFEGQGSVIAEEAGVYETVDSTVSGSLKVGIEF